MLVKNHFRIRALFGGALALLVAAASAQLQVTTYHNDNLRTGLNSKETILTPTNVNPTTFGLLYNLPVDGQVYAQPLYLQAVKVPNKGSHNVVYVVTEHNSVYAYDADSNTGANAAPLWHVNLGPSVPNGDTGSGDINPEIGITSTPVIHTLRNGTRAMYVISKTKTTGSNGNAVYTNSIHVLNVTSGAELLKGPFIVSGQVPGVGDGSVNGIVKFNPLIQQCRPALLMIDTPGRDSTLYVAFASHGDNGPYHGWVFAYDAELMVRSTIINTTPNALTDPSGYPLAAGGIWQGGGGLASDGYSVYFSTGNGTFDPSTKAYGDSILRYLIRSPVVADYFSPADQANLNDFDTDLGSGGVMLLPPSASATPKQKLLVQSGKEGSIYLIDTGNMGKNGTTNNIVQELPNAIGGIWGAPAFFNNTVYFGSVYSSIVAFPISRGLFTSAAPSSLTPTGYAYPGPTPSISSSGVTNGILWAIQTDAYGSNGPAILHAYDATNLATELYNSSATNGRDSLDGAVKFTTPTIVNGKVYAGTSDAVAVFGLGTWAPNPVVSPASGSYSGTLTVTVHDSNANAQIRYTTDGTTPTTASKLYSTPLKFTSTLIFKTRAFLAGAGASAVTENDYLVNAVIGTGTGLTGNYYNNSQNPSGTPTLTEIDPTVNWNWNGNPPVNGVAGSNWAGEWTGEIQAMTTGTYTITTNSDDGVQLSMNGNMVINDYNYHGPTYDSATVTFVAGKKYKILIDYFQGGGGSLLQLFWSAPGIPFQIVPATQLYSK